MNFTWPEKFLKDGKILLPPRKSYLLASSWRMPPFDSEAGTLEALREGTLEINWLLSSLHGLRGLWKHTQSSTTAMWTHGKLSHDTAWPVGKHSCWSCWNSSSLLALSCHFTSYSLSHLRMAKAFLDLFSSEFCSLTREQNLQQGCWRDSVSF